MVTIAVIRDNEVYSYDVTLKNQNNNTALVKSADSFYNDLLGASLQKVSRDEANDLRINRGLKVVGIKDGILRRGGISEGFVITEINGVDVDSQNSISQALQVDRGNTVRMKGVYPNGTRVAYEFMR